MRAVLGFGSFVLAATVLSACGGGGGSSSPPATALELEVSPASVSAPLGTLVPFQARCTFSDGGVHDVTTGTTWTSSDAAVASLDAQGRAQTHLQGAATITAEYAGLSAYADLDVVAPVLSTIAILPADPSLPRGDSLQLAATGHWTDGGTQDLTQSATWSSVHPAVVSVDAGGLAHALAIGSTTVRADHGGITGTTSFTVLAPPLVSIDLAPDAPSIPRGLPQSFTATGTYSDGLTQNLTATATWTSSNPSVATISSAGVATTLTVGTSTIRAALAGVQDTTVLTVTPETLVSIEVLPGSSKLARASTRTFVARGTYTNQSVLDVTAICTWTSSAPEVAGLNGAATATGRLPGVTTITATSGAISGSAQLHVHLPLARTGQTTCFGANGTVIPCSGTGQDGELQAGAAWPAPRFVVGTATDAGCVTDLLTGLMWKAAPDGQTPWVWLDALAAANALTDNGYEDWRLPTRRELRSLIHHGWANNSTWLAGLGFSVLSTDWWTCDTFLNLPSNANNVDMYWGVADVYDKSGGPRFWAVRTANEEALCRAGRTGQITCSDALGTPIACAGTGQDGDVLSGVPWPVPRFAPGSGVTADLVVDQLTGLEWLRTPDGVARTWQQALDYANALVAAGYGDWRLPNVVELESLYNAGVVNSASWLDTQGFVGTRWDYHWTSTSVTLAPEQAWSVHSGLGYVWFHPKSGTHPVWPVRGP